jgi:hypothetical protein
VRTCLGFITVGDADFAGFAAGGAIVKAIVAEPDAMLGVTIDAILVAAAGVFGLIALAADY